MKHAWKLGFLVAALAIACGDGGGPTDLGTDVPGDPGVTPDVPADPGEPDVPPGDEGPQDPGQPGDAPADAEEVIEDATADA
ncbi:MAG TPA: hypothetical protein PK313_03175, partial [Myxococcota bacterium]|nr:hypothetical protein [Myxococcota bacterium]